MKNLFLVVAVGASAILGGCATTSNQPTEPVQFEKIYPMQGLTQAQIYDGSRQWFATAFRSANAVIQYEDKTTGSIIGKGNMRYQCAGFGDCMLATGEDRVDFTVRIDTKEERLRVSYENLVHHRPSHMSGNIRVQESNQPITKDKPSAQKVVAELNSLSDTMAEKIKTQQKINADW